MHSLCLVTVIIVILHTRIHNLEYNILTLSQPLRGSGMSRQKYEFNQCFDKLN